MITAILVAGVMSMSQGTARDEYTERSLCELWVGARCQANACQENAKERCIEESRRCRSQSAYEIVPRERASRVASCARAMLKNACGGPSPAECADVSGY